MAQKNLKKGEVALKIDLTNPLGEEMVNNLGKEEKIDVYLSPKKIGSKSVVFAFLDEDCSNSRRVGRLEEVVPGSMISEGVNNIITLAEIVESLNAGSEYECFGNELFDAGLGHLHFSEVSTQEIKAVEAAEVKKASTTSIEGCAIQGAELDERLEYLASHGVTAETPNEFQCALRLMMPLSVNKEAKPDRLYTNTQKISPIRKILSGLALPARRMTILEGEKSVGKNVCWESMGWLLNRPIEQNTYSARMTAGEALGRPMTKPSESAKLSPKYAECFISALRGENEWTSEASEFLAELSQNMAPSVELKQGALARALLTAEEKGTIYIADEMNLSDANMFSSLFNTITDGHSAYYDIPGLGKVPVSKNLIIGGTRNPLGFVGTSIQNAATMSRFKVVRIKSPDSIKELLRGASYKGIIPSPSVNIKDLINDASDLYDAFAGAVRAKTVSDSCLNYRGFQAAVGEALAGIPLKDAVMENVIYNSEDERSIPVLESIIEQHLV